MTGLWRFFKGYLVLLVEGEQLERFLNICRKKGISLWSVTRVDANKIKLSVFCRDFIRMIAVRRKTGGRIWIIRKAGAPFWVMKVKKRKTLYEGMVLCLILMLILSGRIWDIHIEGNVGYSSSDILSYLNSQGIVHGIPASKIDCREIADLVRKHFPDITWVSARLSGSRFLLTVQEGKKPGKLLEQKPPCSIVCDHDGKIVKMITREGNPLMCPGECCKRGEILVDGRIEILNDEKEVTREELVHADADIYVEYPVFYYDKCPVKYEKEILTDNTRYGYGMQLGKLFFSTCREKEKNRKTIVQEIPICLTETLKLPLTFYRYTMKGYRKESAIHTGEEMKEIACSRFHVFERGLIESGKEIRKNVVRMGMEKENWVVRGKLMVMEKIGKEVPVSSER